MSHINKIKLFAQELPLRLTYRFRWTDWSRRSRFDSYECRKTVRTQAIIIKTKTDAINVSNFKLAKLPAYLM